MRRLSSRAIVLILLVFALSLVASCATPAAAPTTAPAAYAAATAAPAARAPLASSDSNSASEGKQADSGSTTQPTTAETLPLDRMIIRTSNVALTVEDVEATLASIRNIAANADGYVATSQTQYVGDKQTASMTVQIPAKSFDNVLDQVRKLAVKVDSENTTSQDVTEEYTDLQSQINNLKATEAGMVRLLDKATSMNDIIAIQRELTTVRGQIEKAQGRVNFLQRRTDYSTLTVKLSPVAAEVEALATSTWQPLRTISRAWQASLNTISAVADAVLAVVVFLWWLIPIAAVGIWLWRRQRRRTLATASAGGGPTAPSSGTT
jgi:uncharacterized protein DUF4349